MTNGEVMINTIESVMGVEFDKSFDWKELNSHDVVIAFDGSWWVKENTMTDRIKQCDAVQGWIPIKDGLPKPYKDVMATVWFEDDGDDDDAFEIAFGFLNKFGKWDLRLADGSECIKGFYVQAWQPLPKPYKGGDSE